MVLAAQPVVLHRHILIQGLNIILRTMHCLAPVAGVEAVASQVMAEVEAAGVQVMVVEVEAGVPQYLAQEIIEL